MAVQCHSRNAAAMSGVRGGCTFIWKAQPWDDSRLLALVKSCSTALGIRPALPGVPSVVYVCRHTRNMLTNTFSAIIDDCMGRHQDVIHSNMQMVLIAAGMSAYLPAASLAVCKDADLVAIQGALYQL